MGLRFCARAPSSCGKQGPLFIAVRGPPTVMASPVAGDRLQTRRLQTRRLSSRGSQAQLLRGMRDPPGPGHEPVSPAPAGGPPTTAPPGKPGILFYFCCPEFLKVSKKHHAFLRKNIDTINKILAVAKCAPFCISASIEVIHCCDNTRFAPSPPPPPMDTSLESAPQCVGSPATNYYP